VDITPNREAIARYGLTVRDVQDVVEAAIGGMPVSTAIAGRARFSINLRFAADQRSDPQALRALLVGVPSSGDVADADAASMGAGASAASTGLVTAAGAGGGGMGAMGAGSGPGGATSSMGGMSSGLLLPQMAGSQQGRDFIDQWRQPNASVPLGQLADVRVTTGPPMIKDENGTLVGYVFADIDQTERDLGGWVNDAKAVVAAQLTLPPGYRLQWTGRYDSSPRWRRAPCVIPSRWSWSCCCCICPCAGGHRPSSC
jgi:Cu(I)/Ag(I) efflux system membrane protein CusA/SilA